MNDEGEEARDEEQDAETRREEARIRREEELSVRRARVRQKRMGGPQQPQAEPDIPDWVTFIPGARNQAGAPEEARWQHEPPPPPEQIPDQRQRGPDEGDGGNEELLRELQKISETTSKMAEGIEEIAQIMQSSVAEQIPSAIALLLDIKQEIGQVGGFAP